MNSCAGISANGYSWYYSSFSPKTKRPDIVRAFFVRAMLLNYKHMFFVFIVEQQTLHCVYLAILGLTGNRNRAIPRDMAFECVELSVECGESYSSHGRYGFRMCGAARAMTAWV